MFLLERITRGRVLFSLCSHGLLIIPKVNFCSPYICSLHRLGKKTPTRKGFSPKPDISTIYHLKYVYVNLFFVFP